MSFLKFFVKKPHFFGAKKLDIFCKFTAKIFLKKTQKKVKKFVLFFIIFIEKVNFPLNSKCFKIKKTKK